MEDLDKLLSFLDVDRTKAAERYEQIRSRLIRLFNWRGAMSPEDLADKTIDRAASRLQAGAKISDPFSYFAGTAYIIYKEHRRRELQQYAIDSAISSSLSEGEMQESPIGDRRVEALQVALRELPEEQRALLLSYYQENERIGTRQELAQSLGLTAASLRVRVHRIRRRLTQRVAEILEADNSIFSEPQAADQSQAADLAVSKQSGEPDILVIWDPEILSPEEYAELLAALGDLVRASGGLGLSRAQPEDYSVPAFATVPV